MRHVVLAALAIFAQTQPSTPAPPDTEIFLAPLSARDGALTTPGATEEVRCYADI